MSKLGAKNTADMIIIAIGIGLLDVHDLIGEDPDRGDPADPDRD